MQYQHLYKLNLVNLSISKLQMIPDDLLDQLNKLKYLQRAFGQTKDSNEQVSLHTLKRNSQLIGPVSISMISCLPLHRHLNS